MISIENIASAVCLEQKSATGYRFSQVVLRIYSDSAHPVPCCRHCQGLGEAPNWYEGGLTSRNTKINLLSLVNFNFAQGNCNQVIEDVDIIYICVCV